MWGRGDGRLGTGVEKSPPSLDRASPRAFNKTPTAYVPRRVTARGGRGEGGFFAIYLHHSTYCAYKAASTRLLYHLSLATTI